MLAKSVFVVSALVIGTAASAQTFPQSAPAVAQAASAPAASQKTFYYWLHPKLGMVKVDRASNAMLTGTRSRPDKQG